MVFFSPFFPCSCISPWCCKVIHVFFIQWLRNSELLSCKKSRRFLVTEFHLFLYLQFLVSEIQYQKSEIWTWVTAAITYPKHKVLGHLCEKMSIKPDTITSCLIMQSSLLIIYCAISKINICSEYVWILFSQLFLPKLYDSVIDFLSFSIVHFWVSIQDIC